MKKLSVKAKLIVGASVGILALSGPRPGSGRENLVEASTEKNHTVQSGDTMWQIALDHNIDLSDLLVHNNKTMNSIIHPGDVIYLRGKSGTIEKTKSVETKKKVSAPVAKTGYRKGLTDDKYQVLLEVVQQESGGQNYEAVLAVMSVITNRVDSGHYGGKDVWSVITAKTQFEAYGAGHYLRHRGKITDTTKRAVEDALNGKKNVTVMNFWSAWYAKQKGVTGQNIGGNVFFNL